MNVSEELIREIVTKVLRSQRARPLPTLKSTWIQRHHRHQDQHRQV